MKKFYFLFLLALCATFFCSCGVKKVDNRQKGKAVPPKKEVSEREAGLQSIKDGEFRVGINQSEFSKELVDAFAKENGLQVEVTYYNSLENAKKALDDEEIQMYLGDFPKESKDTIDFYVSSPYLKASSSVVSLSEDYSFNKETDVAGYVENTAQEMLVENYFANSKGYDNINSLMNALSSGKIDCAFVNTATFNKSGFFGKGYFECDTFSYSLVAVFKQENEELAKEAEVFFAKLKASGTADDISEKYFGENLIIK